MIVQAEPNTMLPELEFEREHRVKMITFFIPVTIPAAGEKSG